MKFSDLWKGQDRRLTHEITEKYLQREMIVPVIVISAEGLKDLATNAAIGPLEEAQKKEDAICVLTFADKAKATGGFFESFVSGRVNTGFR